MLLGRWTLIAERHAGGCTCCPGLGDVAIEQVEARVTAWLSGRHPIHASFTALLRQCISGGSGLPSELFQDVDEALSDLERVQAGAA